MNAWRDAACSLEAVWLDVLDDLGIVDAARLTHEESDPGRRVYLSGGDVYKIAVHELEAFRRMRLQDLAGEAAILRLCAGIGELPRVKDLRRIEGVDVLVMEMRLGTSLEDQRLTGFGRLFVFARLAVVLARLSLRGVSHGDLLARHVLVGASGRLSLLDFDQALAHRRSGAARRNFTGGSPGRSTHGSFRSLWKETSRTGGGGTVGRALRRRFGRLRSYVSGRAETNSARLPALPTDASDRARSVDRAWRIAENSDASSPGRKLAYYAFDFEGHQFPGERPWADRWKILRELSDFRGLRSLELGCNMGLLSSHLLMEAGASYACGVDKEPDILGAGQLVADALGVQTRFEQVDFDADVHWEQRLQAHKPDVVFALNVFNWIDDKQRFLRFVSSFDWLIYEGHDPFRVEWSRLRQTGFSRIELVATTERERPLMVCRKS